MCSWICSNSESNNDINKKKEKTSNQIAESRSSGASNHIILGYIMEAHASIHADGEEEPESAESRQSKFE